MSYRLKRALFGALEAGLTVAAGLVVGALIVEVTDLRAERNEARDDALRLELEANERRAELAVALDSRPEVPAGLAP